MGRNPLSPYRAPSPASTAHSILFALASIASVGSVVSIHDSSSSSDQFALCPSTSIKEKPSDTGISDITDKDSRLEAKKITDLHLQ
jgi:hypothetical protein